MSAKEFRGISFDDPRSQAEFERLVAAVAAAEREREPFAQRHAQAERDLDDGALSEEEFEEIDDQYIAANNKIAAAKRAVDSYLTQNNVYKTQ
jgi:hypothetical protein